MNFTIFQRCLLSLITKATLCCELTIAFLQQKRFMNFLQKHASVLTQTTFDTEVISFCL